MEASRSLPKPNKQPQSRGAKAESNHESNKETLTQKENSRSVAHRRDLLPGTLDECSVGSRAPQDRRRGRSSRLIRPAGRPSSQDRVKGKMPHVSNTGTSSPTVPSTPDEEPTEQNQSPIMGPAEEASRGIHQAVEEDLEVKPTMDDRPLTEQQLGLRQAEERLHRDYIHRLLKQSPDYPNYKYLCKLCSVHIENIQGAHKHIKEKRHKKNIMV